MSTTLEKATSEGASRAGSAPRRPIGSVFAAVGRDILSTFTRMVPYRFSGEFAVCELCGGRESEVVGRRDRYGNRLRTVLCSGCGLVFTNPMPTAAEADSFYARHYRNHYHGALRPRRKALLKARRGAVARCRGLIPLLEEGDRVIDVGAGTGDFVHELQLKGVRAEGIEPNARFADYASQTYGVPIHVGGWQDISIAPRSVDVVTAHHVLEHFRHPLAALRAMREWLKPGGILLLAVPNVESPHRTPYGRFHFAHLYNFNHASLVMMARKAGFLLDPTSGTSTELVLRNPETPPAEWMVFPDNYERLRHYFSHYTNRRYFLSATPYRRWIARMLRLGRIMAEAQFRFTPPGAKQTETSR